MKKGQSFKFFCPLGCMVGGHLPIPFEISFGLEICSGKRWSILLLGRCVESQSGKAEARCGHRASHRPKKYLSGIWCAVKEEYHVNDRHLGVICYCNMTCHILDRRIHDPCSFPEGVKIERPSCAIGVHCVRGWNLRRAEGGTAHCDCCTPDTIHGFPATPPVLIFLQTDFHFMNKESTASLVYKLGEVTSLISDKTKS